jgi:tetratricopeptide (TPR) repeat protein
MADMAEEKTENSVDEPSPGYLLDEGIELFKKCEWENALQVFVHAQPEDPDEILEVAYYTGLCYTKLKCFAEAQPYLEKFIHESKDNVRVYQCRMTLAYIYVMTKRAKLAEYELTLLVNNGFESAQLFATMAYAAWTQQATQNAIDWYERALSVDRENLTAMNGLGFILADTKKDVKRGLRFCKRAVEKKPENPVYLDSLGWAYFKDGRIEDAKKYLYRAREFAPDNKDIQDHIAFVERK